MVGVETDGPMGHDDTTRRGFLKATGVAAAATLGSTANAAATTSQGKPSNRTLNLQSDSEPGSLDPVQSTDTASGAVIEQLFDGLTTFPDGFPQATGAVASGVELIDDRTYHFHIDPDAVFHGGYGSVTATDVVYSFERVATSPHSHRKGFLFDLLGVEHDTDDAGNYIPGSLGVEAVDTRTVEIRLQSPFHGALRVLAYSSFSIVPEGIVDDVPGYEGELSQPEFASNPVGTGPFEFVERTPGESITVERFGDYYGEKAWVAEIQWDITPSEAKLDRVNADELDLWSLSGVQFDPELRTVDRVADNGAIFGTYGPLENGRTANFQAIPTQTIFYLGFNCGNVPQHVRRAVSYAVNQTEIVERFWPGQGVPAAHFTPPTLYPGGSDAYEDHASSYPYGRDESRTGTAAEIMSSAGYGPDNPYQITWKTYGGETLDALGEYLSDVLGDAHIELKHEPVGWSPLLSAIRQGNVEMFHLGWVTDWPGAENVLQLLYPPYSDTDTPENRVSGFDWDGTGPAAARAKAAFERVLEHRGPNEADESVRQEAYVDIEEANWDGVAAVPLLHQTEHRFWFDWVDPEPFGSMGPRNQKLTSVKLQPKQSTNGNGNGGSNGQGR